MNVEALTKELDWFCLHLVETGCMAKEDCAAIFNALDENNIDYSLDVFIQVMQDNGRRKN